MSFLKIDSRFLKIHFSRLSLPDVTVTIGCSNILGCRELWCSHGGGWWWRGRPTDWTHRLNRPPPYRARG